jgi:hypothetical protein
MRKCFHSPNNSRRKGETDLIRQIVREGKAKRISFAQSFAKERRNGFHSHFLSEKIDTNVFGSPILSARFRRAK